jgi:hypothetical protein
MAKNRGKVLEDEISTLEDAILHAESKGEKGLEEAKVLLDKIKIFFEQGTWGVVEKELAKTEDIIGSEWFIDFIEKKVQAKGGRFIEDGLCQKYGHEMVQIKISNVRWFYECRICKKKGKKGSIR